jgi:hypothetical protein
MKSTLKYIAFSLICIVGIVGLVRLGSCGDSTDEVSVRIPADSSFSAVTERKYRPRSTPFEHPLKPAARLPKGLAEANVARIVRVIKRSAPSEGRDSSRVAPSEGLRDTTTLIITKDDQVFVSKQQGVETTVEDTKFVAPIIHVGVFASIGISLAKFGIPHLEVSPSVAVAPLEILGKIQLPLLAADLDGVAVGLGYRYKGFVFAVAGHQRFEDAGRSVRIMIHYSL